MMDVVASYARASNSLSPIEDAFNLPTDRASGLTPFQAHQALTGVAYDLADIDNLAPLMVRGCHFYVTSAMSETLDSLLYLRGHRAVAPDEEFRERISGALHLLAEYDSIWSHVQTFVRTLCVVAKVGPSGEPLLTSCTLPEFPGMIVFSSKASRHIPPASIVGHDSTVLLAENIFHESVHQIVNMGILFDDVLSRDFRSDSSPKIQIPWRRSSSPRNQEWELDRALHAAAVYVKLIEWRIEILRRSDLRESEIEIIRSSLAPAREAAAHLIGSLSSHHVDAFGDAGRQLIANLEARFSTL